MIKKEANLWTAVLAGAKRLDEMIEANFLLSCKTSP
jgi:hypothetical protein